MFILRLVARANKMKPILRSDRLPERGSGPVFPARDFPHCPARTGFVLAELKPNICQCAKSVPAIEIDVCYTAVTIS